MFHFHCKDFVNFKLYIQGQSGLSRKPPAAGYLDWCLSRLINFESAQFS